MTVVLFLCWKSIHYNSSKNIFIPHTHTHTHIHTHTHTYAFISGLHIHIIKHNIHTLPDKHLISIHHCMSIHFLFHLFTQINHFSTSPPKSITSPPLHPNQSLLHLSTQIK